MKKTIVFMILIVVGIICIDKFYNLVTNNTEAISTYIVDKAFSLITNAISN